MKGRRLFAQDSRLGVTELDVTDTQNPRVIRRVLAADGWGGAIDVCDGVAYVTSEGGNIVNYQLQTVDVHDPLKPQLADLQAGYREMTSPVTFKQRLFVIAKGGPAVLDVSSTPLRPRPIRQFKEIGGGMAHGRAIRIWRDKVVCCPMYGGKFGLLEAKQDGSWEVTEVVRFKGTCLSVACDDRHLYQLVSDPRREEALPGPTLNVWELDASPPSLVSQLTFEGWPPGGRVDHRDGYLFLWLDRHGGWSYPGYWRGAGSRGWLVVVDVRDPKKPEIVTYYPTGSLIEVLGISRIDGSFLYLASYMGNNLEVVDVADPHHPVQAAAWRHKGQPFYYLGDLDIDRGRGYLTTPYSVEVLRLPLSGQQPRGPLAWRE